MFTPSFSYTNFLQPRPIPSQGTDVVASTPKTFIPVKVYPNWFKSLTIEWTPSTSWTNKAPRYNIWRSESDTTGFQKLNSVPFSEPWFKDETNLDSSTVGKTWYSIEVILNDGTTWTTPAVDVVAQRPRWHELRANEIRRREWLMLTRFMGVDTVLLKKLDHGVRCPECWDFVSEKVTQDHCLTCYGTGFAEGYYKGIRTFIQYDVSSDTRSLTYFGPFEANQIGAWTIDIPKISPHDIVIRLSDFNIYRVEQLQYTEILTQEVRQMLMLTQLGKSDVEYRLLKREGLTSVHDQ